MGTRFASGEDQWRSRLGTLRQVVRQEVVARQLAIHLPDGPTRRVLDVGCGQGTQALRLARRGHHVVGLDSSVQLLEDLRRALEAEAPGVRERVRVLLGDAEKLTDLFASASFDAVLCHGVLMYFDDPRPLLTAIAQVTAPGGIVSLLVRNGDALAMRSGLLGEWDSVEQAFEGNAYLNRIGVEARADRLEDLTAMLTEEGMPVLEWYGVRVFTDAVASDASPPGPERLSRLLAFEERAGRTDPYRRVGALLHLIAIRQEGRRRSAEVTKHSFQQPSSARSWQSSSRPPGPGTPPVSLPTRLSWLAGAPGAAPSQPFAGVSCLRGRRSKI